jgi:hypothetical protein
VLSDETTNYDFSLLAAYNEYMNPDFKKYCPISSDGLTPARDVRKHESDREK